MIIKGVEFAKRYTTDLAKLLIHLIPQMTKTWPCHELAPLVRALRDEGLEARQLSRIQSALIALGCNETL